MLWNKQYFKGVHFYKFNTVHLEQDKKKQFLVLYSGTWPQLDFPVGRGVLDKAKPILYSLILLMCTVNVPRNLSICAISKLRLANEKFPICATIYKLRKAPRNL